ncbi:MAG: hypothetical protein E7169_05340 [Firmicutes bacterium]|nr:hypothetical protein [Bacillota bacterium]
MLVRVFLFLTGFGLTVIGSVYIISYLNLLTIGYNFLEYVNFISRQLECLYFVLGIILMFLTIFISEGEKDEFYI